MVPSERPDVALFLLKEFLNRTYKSNYGIRNDTNFDWTKESWFKHQVVASQTCRTTSVFGRFSLLAQLTLHIPLILFCTYQKEKYAQLL